MMIVLEKLRKCLTLLRRFHSPDGTELAAIGMLRALQDRVSALHEAQLLMEDETVAIEDLVADYIEARMATQDHIITREMTSSSSVAGMPGFGAARRLQLLIGLSEAMDVDVAFARQARRKAL